jgi:hypothetical protein
VSRDLSPLHEDAALFEQMLETLRSGQGRAGDGDR